MTAKDLKEGKDASSILSGDTTAFTRFGHPLHSSLLREALKDSASLCTVLSISILKEATNCQLPFQHFFFGISKTLYSESNLEGRPIDQNFELSSRFFSL